MRPGPTGTRDTPFDPATDTLRALMQRDEIGERDYCALRAAEPGRRIGRSTSARDLMVAAYEQPEERIIRPEVADAVVSVRRAGKRVGLLTNELELLHGRRWVDGLAVLRQLRHHSRRSTERASLGEALAPSVVEDGCSEPAAARRPIQDDGEEAPSVDGGIYGGDAAA